MKKAILFSMIVSFILSGCKSTTEIVTTKKDDGKITFNLLAINDVYEIAPLGGGEYGGMARVAHIHDSIKKINPNTFLFMAGDFLNPSLLGTIKYNGERIRGKQMIEVMNAMDFDLVTFGNHEFDLSESELQKRLDESNFQWISSNTFHKIGDKAVPFKSAKGDVAFTYAFNLSDKDGTNARVNFFSTTTASNPQEYVYYGDINEYAKKAIESLTDNDVLVGFTHNTLAEDIALVKFLPQTAINLIIGGHEHNNMLVPVNDTKIAKADANAKTVYLHTFTLNKNTSKLDIDSKLISVNEKTGSNTKVKAIVDKWETILDSEIKNVISNPDEVVYKAAVPLDGTDDSGRSKQTNLGLIISHAMADAFEGVDAAFVNGGSFRLDDKLSGDITSLDIFRVLPFGGSIYKVTVKGSLLKEILEYGENAIGTGAYLQLYNFKKVSNGEWLIEGKSIKDSENYKVATTDFLLKGYDIPFLKPENKGIVEVYKPIEIEVAYDIRKAVIAYLKNLQIEK